MRPRAQACTLVAMAALVIGCGPAAGVEMEKHPAYLTDSHGASGVVHAFLELSEVAGEYEKYWKGALDWLIAVAERDAQGRLAWRMSTTAPQGHPSRRINVAGTCHILRMFFAGHRQSREAKYRAAALAGVRMLVERFARKKQTPLGTAYAWSHSYRANDKSPGMLAGHSHGLGNIIDVLLDAHEAAPGDELKRALRGVLINLRLRGRRVERDGGAAFAWPALKNRSIFETGYCYGQAGLVLPLLRLAEAMPDLKLSDGTTARSLANANLRYLMSVAVRRGGGLAWPYMRHNKTSRNIGLGSGTGGIGWAFLRAAEVNAETDPPFAAECMKHARGAVMYAVELVESYRKRGPLPGPGGDAGFGVCGGAGGAGHLLILYANKIRRKDPATVKRIDAVVERVARAVMGSAVEVDGALACPDRVHFKRINIALDYGQTGVVLGLTVAGRYLKNDEILRAARKVADYIARRAVRESGGYKFAQFHPLPE